jgi:site-specific DNA-methyltransferase (adenine-specific)
MPPADLDGGGVSLRYLVGDVRDRLADIPDNSVDLVVTSPPFLALRSYLPADHPDKHREIGSEPTPADFIDTLPPAGGGDASPLNVASGQNPAGAPPLDWHADNHPEDGDWLWKLSTQPYSGSHYATFPLTLPKRLIEAMCPLRVCVECGRPSERMVGDAEYVPDTPSRSTDRRQRDAGFGRGGQNTIAAESRATRVAPTLGWTDCGHNQWRTGIVLDPFAGSGTTLEAAQIVGRHAIGIDLDARNADLARDRVGMFLEVDAA